MAPKKGTKRAQTSQEAKGRAPAEKKTKTDNKPKTQATQEAKAPVTSEKKPKTDSKFKPVVDAIQQSADLTDTCRQMLLSTIPGSLGTPCDLRHETQHLCVKMIGEALEDVAAYLQTAINDQHTQLADLEKSKAELLTKLKAAEDVVIATATAEHDKKLGLAEAAQTLADAKAALQEKQEVQRRGDSALDEAEAQKAILVKAIEVPLKTIVQGELEPTAAEDHYSALKPAIQLLRLEDSLTTALPASCVRPKCQRGIFDNMVIEQLEKTFTAKVNELTCLLNDGAATKLRRAEAVQAATAELDTAKDLNQTLAHELIVLQTELKNAQAAASAAKADVDGCEPQRMDMESLRDTKVSELENFKLYNIGTFVLLRDAMSTPIAAPPPPERVQESVASADTYALEPITETTSESEITAQENPVEPIPVQEPIAERTAPGETIPGEALVEEPILMQQPVAHSPAKADVIMREARIEAQVSVGGA